MRLKIFIATGSIFLFSGCTAVSDAGQQNFYERAVADASSQPKAIHLAYLQCYALEKADKERCQHRVRNTLERRKESGSQEYDRLFDYEAERLGFTAFLHERGKECYGVDQGPVYQPKQQAYEVICKGSKPMR